MPLMSTGVAARISDCRARAGEWYAYHKKELVFGAIIFVVATLSFGLGYLSNRELNHAPIVIERVESSK